MTAMAFIGAFLLGMFAGYCLRQITGCWSFDDAYQQGVADERERWLGRRGS